MKKTTEQPEQQVSKSSESASLCVSYYSKKNAVVTTSKAGFYAVLVETVEAVP